MSEILQKWSEWDNKPMSQIETEIKDMVDHKLHMGFYSDAKITDDINILISRKNDDSALVTDQGSWVIDLVPSKVFFKSIDGVAATLTEEGKTQLALKGDSILLDGSIDTAKDKPVKFGGSVTFSADVKGVSATFDEGVSAKELKADELIIGESIIIDSLDVDDQKISRLSIDEGSFTNLSVTTLAADNVTSENLIGSNLYIGESATDTTKIKLTPTSYETEDIKATKKLTATSAKIGNYHSFDGDYNFNNTVYRPVLFTKDIPTVEKEYTPGLLIAVID